MNAICPACVPSSKPEMTTISDDSTVLSLLLLFLPFFPIGIKVPAEENPFRNSKPNNLLFIHFPYFYPFRIWWTCIFDWFEVKRSDKNKNPACENGCYVTREHKHAMEYKRLEMWKLCSGTNSGSNNFSVSRLRFSVKQHKLNNTVHLSVYYIE